MPRFLLGVLITLVIATPSSATEQRWTNGYGQGTLEAIIRNDDGSSVNIYCPSGGTDTTPGMLIETTRIHPQAKQQVDVQFVVNGRRFAFVFDEIQFEARDNDRRDALRALIDALAQSREKTFILEFSQAAVSESFSLLGAREALGSGRDFLDGCL